MLLTDNLGLVLALFVIGSLVGMRLMIGVATFVAGFFDRRKAGRGDWHRSAVTREERPRRRQHSGW